MNILNELREFHRNKVSDRQVLFEDVVLIQDDTLPRNRCRMAIFIVLHETTQLAIHGQTTLKQRYFNVVYNVYTTLFQRRLIHDVPAGQRRLCMRVYVDNLPDLEVLLL